MRASAFTQTLRMPFNMFKAFSGSRNRSHRGDPAIYTDYPQGYPPGVDFLEPEPGLLRSQPQLEVSRRSSTKRREPVFTPLPSRTPSDAEEYNEGYIRVDSPDAVMRGALNARPVKMDSVLPPLGLGVESTLSETLSEREHREHAGRLHDIPRLSDRPPQLQRAASFHSGHGDRINPDEPIIMTPSPSRSSSGSDHTIEALRTPQSMHPSERVIPPLPRNYSRRYTSGSRSPTDIYGSHPYEVVHDAHSHHHPEIYLDRHVRGNGKDGPMYYIIPGGMNVIFQDEHGNEITRVGDFSGRSRPAQPGPFVVQDEHGKELYRYDGYKKGSRRGYSEPQILQIDAYPPSGQPIRDRGYSTHSYRSDPSYRRYPDHGECRDYREKDWRDHRVHSYRGHADYPGHGEYRDHRGYSDPSAYREHGDYRDYGGYRKYGGHREYDGYREHGKYRDHGGYRERGGYREHGDYEPQGRLEMLPPRASSRASHRTHTSQVSVERAPQQYPDSIPDDRRSGRDYAPSLAHASVRHPEDEIDINGGLQALHI